MFLSLRKLIRKLLSSLKDFFLELLNRLDRKANQLDKENRLHN